MKKTIILIVYVAMSINAYSQSFVNTNSSNKNVLMEVFTGINCYYCAEGQYLADTIQDMEGTSIVWMNIHSGIFAQPGQNQPDYRSSFAENLANLSDLTAYPAAMFNRRRIAGLEQNGNSYAIARENWQTAVDTILNQAAVVNVAAIADIDVSTNQLKVVVETYYTANAASATNHLFVALLTDSLWSQQLGGEDLNPAAMNSAGKYLHRFVFQDYINGYSGTPITTTTMGSFRADTFYYSLPDSLYGVDVDIPNFKVAVWVATDSADVLNVAYAARSIGGPNPIASSIEAASWTADFNQICGTEGDLMLLVKNLGTDPISSIRVNYDVNSGASIGSQVYSFSQNIYTGYTQSAVISNIPGLDQSSNAVAVSITEINTLPNPNIDVVNTTIAQASVQMSDSTNGVFLMQFDNFPGDIAWYLYDETADSTVLSGSSYTSVGVLLTQNFTAVDGHCYSLKVTDAHGDGLCCAYGPGYFSLSIGSIELIHGNSFTYEDGMKFQWQEGVLATQHLADQVLDWTLFPNPAYNKITLRLESANTADFQLQILNSLGQAMSPAQNYVGQSGIQYIELPVNELPSGFYMVVLKQEQQVYSKKMMVVKE